MLLLVISKLFCFLILISYGTCDEIESRIVNGVPASDFINYQASVRVTIRDRLRFGRGHTCGGVLITTQTVVTAAHCLFAGNQQRDVFDLRVVLGSINRHVYTKETVIVSAEKIIVHPGYKRSSFENDIGLIILRSPVELSDNVNIIPIIDEPVEPYANCQISGWGATSWLGSMPSELQKANVSIIPRSICGSDDVYGRTIVDGMVCANGVNENGIIDVCQGDSGGPLTCNNRLVGLASFGVRCGLAIEFPGVFTDVFYYCDWIKENSGAGLPSHCLSLLILCGFIVFQKLALKLRSFQ